MRGALSQGDAYIYYYKAKQNDVFNITLFNEAKRCINNFTKLSSYTKNKANRSKLCSDRCFRCIGEIEPIIMKFATYFTAI